MNKTYRMFFCTQVIFFEKSPSPELSFSIIELLCEIKAFLRPARFGFRAWGRTGVILEFPSWVASSH